MRSSGAIGSSPHTRGALPSELRRGDGDRIIPAYAGSTPWFIDSRGWLADHPRIRGEHSLREIDMASTPGSSPHTRGARHHHRHRSPAVGIIPAYAGSTPAATLRPFQTPDHPRIRGEHATPRPPSTGQTGSSPHTRGARDPPAPGGLQGRIIPAYAGSTYVVVFC